MAAPNLQLEITEKFDEIGEAGVDILERTLDLIGHELWGQTRREAPVDHGRLAGSFLEDSPGPLTRRTYTDVEYAMFVHEGTDPHTAPWDAIEAWASRHGIPTFPIWYTIKEYGTQENRYGDRAIENTEGRVGDFAQIAADEVLGRYEL